jgi:hypothetical protein
MDGFQGNALDRTCTYRSSRTRSKVKPKEPISTIPVTLTKSSSSDSLSTSINLDEKYDYKTLLFYSLFIFGVVFVIALSYFLIRCKYQNDLLNKNDPSLSFLNNLSQLIRSFFSDLNESTRNRRLRILFHIESLCPNAIKRFRVVNVTSTYNNINANANRSCDRANMTTSGNYFSADDDRLNLAEYQMLDHNEDAINSNPFAFKNFNNDLLSDNDDVHTSSRNPYRSLTMPKV